MNQENYSAHVDVRVFGDAAHHRAALTTDARLVACNYFFFSPDAQETLKRSALKLTPPNYVRTKLARWMAVAIAQKRTTD